MNSKIINIKELIKGILIIGLYFILPSLINIPFIFLSNKFNLSPGIITLLLYLALAIIFCLIYIKTLIKDFKDFKNNYKTYLKKGFNYWLKGLFIMISSSLLISMFNIDTNTNQAANVSLLEQYPLVEIICAIILAPLIEELVFRRSLKNFTTNKHLFAISTGTFFGLLHVTSSLSNPIMIIYLIPYSALGIAFGYIYKHTDNIYSSLTIHSLHNAISIIQLLIIGGL